MIKTIRSYGWPALFLPDDYQDNPKTQIIFHKRMMRLWEITGPTMGLVYLSAFLVKPVIALLIYGFINFVTNQLSVYANWATDFGALSAAEASDKVDREPY